MTYFKWHWAVSILLNTININNLTKQMINLEVKVKVETSLLKGKLDIA